MADITVIPASKTPASVEETMADLKEIIDSGRVVALAWAVVERDGTGGSAFSDTDRAPTMVGVLEFLQRRIMNNSF